MGPSPRQVSPATVFARPTPEAVWLGPRQRAALSGLIEDVHPAPIRALVGGPSVGKTVLLRHAAAGLARSSIVLPCPGPKRSSREVLATLLSAADLAVAGLDELDQRNLLSVFVQHRHAQGKRTVILVDDAHGLEPGAWRELERLALIRAGRGPAVRLLCAGRPPLQQRLTAAVDPARAAFHSLAAPSVADLASYLDWRFRRVQLTGRPSTDTVRLVADLCGGRFSAVDVLCQMAMLVAQELGRETIDEETIRRALAALSARRSGRAPPAPAERTLEQPAPSLDAAPALPRGTLIVSESGRSLERIELGPRTLIGRSAHNDLALPSPYLSRHHAAVVGTPAGFYVVDLNSANGLRVNGRPVARAVLADLDVLTIGPYSLKVRIRPGREAGNPLPPAPSLAATASMPQPLRPQPRIHRVK